ncbi:MAG: ABC transporter ATP-binding protein [bacterium]|nr:ABC transporter ATP-binding protein [bacterium]
MKILLKYLKNYKNLVGLALLLASVNQLFSMLDPYIYGKLVDRFASRPKDYNEHAFIYGAGLLILAAIGVAMVSRIAKAFQDYTLNLIIQKFGAAVYIDGLKHALQLPFQDFEDQRSGELLNVLQKVRTDSEKFILNFINIFFTSFVGIIFVVIYAVQVQPWLIVIYFGASFLLAGLTSILSKKVKVVQQRIVQQTKALAGSTTESLRNIELIKSLGLTQQEMKRLNLSTQKILKLELEKVKDIRSISFLQGTIVNLLRQSILFLLLYMIFKEQMSLGQLMTLQFYSFFIFGPMQEMGNVILSYREAEASLQNFQLIMEKPIEQKPASPHVIDSINEIRFNEVAFTHKTGKQHALNQVSFSAKSGETIAFVGPSGAGKTTLVKLLVGLYQPQVGEVLFNQIESNKIDFDVLRNQIGFVTQDTQLFSGTIKENMLFVNPRATDVQIITALHQASCENLLARSENGINSVIGEGGIKISGGEKQRLSIARALLREPKLIIFDEATSALDSITEEEIGKTIRQISASENHITVMIAHRLSTIMHATRIYVLEKGELVETGKHAELLAQKGLYYAMWRQQIGER